ncbi:MAG TPA: MFS transporter [Blastocatellia bacterium]|nr:MFS transporter [Blastocatellia bacterium]
MEAGSETPTEAESRGTPAANLTPPAAPLRPRLTRALVRSLFAIVVGSLILRLASHTTGLMLQFYFDYISRHYYHLSYTLTGFITASFFITELFGSLVLGAMSDRYGRRLFILLGPVFGLIAVQMTAITVVLWLLVITRLLEGLSTASSVPATLGYISEATVGRPALRARVIGLFEITLVGGIALGASVGGYLWRYFGHRTTVLGIELISPAFALNGLIYLLSLVIFMWGLKDLKRPAGAVAAGNKLQHYRAVLRSRRVWLFIPAWLAIFSVIGVWINNGIRLLTGDAHREGQLLMGNISTVQFGNGQAVLAIIFAAGILAWSFVLARYRKTSVMLVAVGGLFILLGTVYGLNHLGSLTSPLYYPLMAGLLAGVVLLSGFTPAALTYLADVTESYAEDRGSIMGLYSVFLGVGQLLGAMAGGYFAERGGVDGLLWLSAALGVITLMSLLLLRRRHPQEMGRAPLPAPPAG